VSVLQVLAIFALLILSVVCISNFRRFIEHRRARRRIARGVARALDQNTQQQEKS